MLKKNMVQFSVVREDPEIELELFRRFSFKDSVLIGSGGCTVLSLQAVFPQSKITVIEPNKAQLLLLREKVNIIKKSNKNALKKKFGIGFVNDSKLSLIEQGNFETLFRGFRNFIFDFIADRKLITKFLKDGSNSNWQTVFNHRYWPIAFDLYFSNSILETMFGKAAIQHAPPSSYPSYFRSVLEKGLLRRDRKNNYFLYHILLGHYPNHKDSWPPYLRYQSKEIKYSTFNGTAQEFNDYSNYDFISLSNIFDWSSDEQIKELTNKLAKELNPGALVLYRQLNNNKNFRTYFGSSFKWLDRDSEMFYRRDRSLFYSSIHIGRRV